MSDKYPDVFGDDFDSYPETHQDRWGEDTTNQALLNIFNGLAEVSPTSDVDLLIDFELALEDIDLKKTYKLMKIINQSNPKGSFIKRKISQYKKGCMKIPKANYL